MPTLSSNVQDEITYEFTQQAVTLTHPSGVKVVERKADVQVQLDRLQANADAALADKARLQKDVMDRINAAAVVVGP